MIGKPPLSPKNGAGPTRAQIPLLLYVAGATPNSVQARGNLDAALGRIADAKRPRLEVIDVLADGKRALLDSIIVTPTLIVIGPNRRTILIGNLSDSEKLDAVLTGLRFGS
jgi:hypothetical protein